MTKRKKVFLITEIILSAIILVTSIVLIVLTVNKGTAEEQGEVQVPPATESTVTLPPAIEADDSENGPPKTDISIDASAIEKDPNPEVIDTQIEYVTKEETHE